MNVGRTQFPDIVSSVNDFSFTSTSKRDTRGFDIKDDAILENDELFKAEFDISSLEDEGWNARKGEFPITYIAIDDDDCEYTDVCMFVHTFHLYYMYVHVHISVVTIIAMHDISIVIHNIHDTILYSVFIMIENLFLLGVPTCNKPVHTSHVSRLMSFQSI